MVGWKSFQVISTPVFCKPWFAVMRANCNSSLRRTEILVSWADESALCFHTNWSWSIRLPVHHEQSVSPACLPTSELHAFKNVMACAAFPLLTVQLHHSKLLGACYKRPQFHVKNESLIHPCWYSSSKIATKSRFNLILHRACRPWSLVATLPHGLQSQNRTTWPA